MTQTCLQTYTSKVFAPSYRIYTYDHSKVSVKDAANMTENLQFPFL